MHCKKGSNRLVLVLPSLNIVIKFPRIFFWIVFKDIFRKAVRGKWKSIKKWFSFSIESYGSYNRNLFKGIHDNWSEYKFFRKTQHRALEQTYFSLFGFLNIQRYGEPYKFSFDVILPAIVKLIGADAAIKDGHHFGDSANFSFRENKIRYVDYGSKKTQDVILEFGEKITNELDVIKLKEEQKNRLKE